MTPTERFWAKVKKTDGCWEWTAAKTLGGYGKIKWPSGFKLAHRLSLELATGTPPPSDRLVLHSCDNPACVNPAHLSIGTQLDNMRDCALRGRHVPNAKLKRGEVGQIRALLATGATHQSIANNFKVARQTITNIATGHRWSP